MAKKREPYPRTLERYIEEYEAGREEPWGSIPAGDRELRLVEERELGKSWVSGGRLQEGEIG